MMSTGENQWKACGNSMQIENKMEKREGEN